MTGVILAGGASKRMGSNKALLLHRHGRIIEVIYRTLAAIFHEVIVVTNSPEQYPFLPCRKVPDISPGFGIVSGIHAGLQHSVDGEIFVVGCDMPMLHESLIRYLLTRTEGVDVVVPVSLGGHEPLHAVYGRACLPALEKLMQEGNQRVLSLLPQVRVREVYSDEISRFDRWGDSFVNINTPDDYYRLRSAGFEVREEALLSECYVSVSP